MARKKVPPDHVWTIKVWDYEVVLLPDDAESCRHIAENIFFVGVFKMPDVIEEVAQQGMAVEMNRETAAFSLPMGIFLRVLHSTQAVYFKSRWC